MIDATSLIEYSHDELLAGIHDITDQIKNSSFDPDYIVGIIRGGAIPAVYLSHSLKLPVHMIPWSKRDNHLVNGNNPNNWIVHDINQGSKVLIVDDIVDGGETVRDLLSCWDEELAFEDERLNYGNIRIASLWYNTAQQTKVDFYHKEINRNEDRRWVIFPWEA